MHADEFNPENIIRTAFFTGHRHLSEYDKPWIADRLSQILIQAYDAGYRKFICGGALGFDTIAAFQTLRLREKYPDVKLLLAIPCSDQTSHWRESDCEAHRRIIAMADEVTVLSPVYYQGVMLARNRYMADRSSLCICYLKQMRGGTASAVRYALIHDRITVINLAVFPAGERSVMRENAWNCMFISPSASKNAVTVPLHLMQKKKRNMHHISVSC